MGGSVVRFICLLLVLMTSDVYAVKLFLSGNDLLEMLEPNQRGSGAGAYYVMELLTGLMATTFACLRTAEERRPRKLCIFTLKITKK